MVVLLLLYGLVNPAESFFPRCPIHALTGWQCPGCGSQRAIHALLNGDMAQAWGYNPMLFFFLPVIALMFLSELFRDRMPRLNRTLTSTASVACLLIILLVWTVVRNLLHI